MFRHYFWVICGSCWIAFAPIARAQVMKTDSANQSPVSFSAGNSLTIAAFTTVSRSGKLSVNPFVSGNIGKFYFENRYNYEAANSASLNIGRTLNKTVGGFTFTPIVGLLVGDFKGINTEVQVYRDERKWYFSADNQYVFEYTDIHRSFYYNWLVGRYKLTSFFRIGLTTQFTQSYGQKGVFDRGITTSLLYKNFTFNIYAFNYEAHKRNAFISLRYYIKT